ncbi:dihydroxyacetone kinase phosphoryl donor subunit DhaM [Geodermatophilus sp. YIM 151500]|uniref:dihydroxyacetone kinase phosphoryl donor subunit DhaM n=1 Tax=Geodermatophilus sp. YIM 151500 TaxID=2984531 RepID=UPI0021E37038|nr:dihydroxyacetone kinase phosphoryl donor subunit DhaM [Geodermatophilus sp. YIM 151500]MCV2489338.1 dihydroxyacetone kinase phosphoryl donor subunit DhaM [Geodermatophilus sp. YIM 151500]
MPVGLVVVSHSRPLADAAVHLARGMLPGRELAVEVAAGDVDGGLGTDATAIADAITAADSGDGVVVLMDLGSAVLSAETALELLDDAVRERVVLSPAPLVEGLVGAAVTAAAGAGRDRVAAEALRGLAPKQAHLTGG